MFSKEEVIKYYNEQKDLEHQINDLWEIGKKSKAKEKRLKEVTFIIDNLESEKLLKNARKIISIYKTRFGNIEE